MEDISTGAYKGINIFTYIIGRPLLYNRFSLISGYIVERYIYLHDGACNSRKSRFVGKPFTFLRKIKV